MGRVRIPLPAPSILCYVIQTNNFERRLSMIVTLDCLYSDPAENLVLLEHLYNISEQQGTIFVLNLDKREYIFPRSMEREQRTQRFKRIIEKHKPP